jgi:hypothetical protein
MSSSQSRANTAVKKKPAPGSLSSSAKRYVQSAWIPPTEVGFFALDIAFVIIAVRSREFRIGVFMYPL